MRAPETDTVNVTVVRETEKGYLLNDENHCGQAWFPKSEVCFERRNIKTGKAVAIIPLWLIEANGWNGAT